MEELKNIEAERVFENFKNINQIPRCSKNEEKISNYLKNWAEEKNLEVIQDKAYNIIIKKSATDEKKKNSTLILQGHMDMVCEKNGDKEHDFSKDPIDFVVKDDYIYADRTTLGADNGIAVAMFMSILESNEISHPNLEVLITTDEESGMTGVLNLNPKHLEGNTLINLDSEGEGIFTAGCAGGGRLSININTHKKDSVYNNAFRIFVHGLSGGHSGVDIDKEKANSNKLLGRILYKIKDEIDLKSISGGSKTNAIPREAEAVILTDNRDLVENKINNHLELIKKEYQVTDPNINFKLEPFDSDNKKVYTDETKLKIISALNLIKNGPMKKSTEIELVITSNNLGVVKEEDNKVELICAPRSSVESNLIYFTDEMKQLTELLEAEYSEGEFYPGWEYSQNSYIRDLAVKTYKKINNKDPEVIAIHAGLECGFLAEKIEGLDAISFGPNMYDIHTPNEHLSISSTQKTFNLLCEIIRSYEK